VVIILFIFRINADDWIVVRLLCSCLRCPRRFCSSADKLLLLFNLHILIYFFAINRQQPSVLRVSDLREILRGGGTPDPRDPYWFCHLCHCVFCVLAERPAAFVWCWYNSARAVRYTNVPAGLRCLQATSVREYVAKHFFLIAKKHDFAFVRNDMAKYAKVAV